MANRSSVISTSLPVVLPLLLWLAFLTGCTCKKPEAPAPVIREAVTPSKWGYDVIGLAKFCNTYLQAPRLPKVSTLLRSFGDPLPCIDKALARGGLTDVQYNLRDATCWRNNVCPPGTPSLTDWKDMRKLALTVNQRAVAHPEVTHWISPYLEHDFKDPKVIQKACAVSLEACPTCKCVNEPMSGTRITGFPLELHGTTNSAWSISGDGSSMFDGDNVKNDGNKFQHRLAGSEHTFGWWDALNLRCTGEKNFVPIEKRTERPTDDQFRQAHKILTTEEPPIPAAPPQCKQVVDLDSRRGEILKTNAEKYCNGSPGAGDVRGDKPLLIIRKNGKPGDKIRVLSPDGKESGCFKYYGPYSGGLSRWYEGSCSGYTPWKFYLSVGGEWAFSELGTGKCLRINTIRRLGSYR